MELAGSIMAVKQAATQQTAQMKILKKSHDMEMAMIDMIAQTAKSAPPPGQGTKVDKTA